MRDSTVHGELTRISPSDVCSKHCRVNATVSKKPRAAKAADRSPYPVGWTWPQPRISRRFFRGPFPLSKRHMYPLWLIPVDSMLPFINQGVHQLAAWERHLRREALSPQLQALHLSDLHLGRENGPEFPTRKLPVDLNHEPGSLIRAEKGPSRG